MYFGADITLGTPTKKNYNFIEWVKTEGEDSDLDGYSFTMGSSKAKVEAVWEVKTCSYTVIHKQQNANDSGYTSVSTQNLTADCGSTQTPTVNTYDQFSKPTAESVTLEEGTTPTIEYEYNRNTYTLTINPNGGSYSESTTPTLKYGQTYNLSTPTKTGYNHTWSLTSGTGASLNGSTFTMGTSAAVVTANWNAKTFTVYFNANGGATSTASKTVTYKSTYGTLPTPTYSGYKFLGWFTDKTDGTQITSSTTANRTTNQTLYAHWKIDTGIETTKKALNITPKTGNPNFANAAKTDEGVYSMADDYGTSYYYRGAVENNYVKFGGFFWRIIRINGDGSIRMIYEGKKAYPNADGLLNVRGNYDGFTHTTVNWNSKEDDAKYVGWMYGGKNGTGSTKQNGEDSAAATYNETDSNVKAKVDTWYKTNIEAKNFDKYLSDEIFCNDRSTAPSGSTWMTDEKAASKGFGKNITMFGAAHRVYDSSLNAKTPEPTFVCPQKNDAFTVNDTTKGNGSLTYPIGLITADEIVAAGSGKVGTVNRYYYLFKDEWYWSISPMIMNWQGIARMLIDGGSYDGGLGGFSLDLGGLAGGGIAPVINLSAEYAITLTGSGTRSSPYQISE